MSVLGVDPWFMVAECDRAIELVADPDRRIILNSLRSCWIALGDDLVCERDGAYQRSAISRIKEIHAELMAGCRNAMH